MATLEPVFVDCPSCGAELLVPVRLVPAPDTDERSANFTVTVSSEPVRRHLERCPDPTT